jgi:hypothetical protein
MVRVSLLTLLLAVGCTAGATRGVSPATRRAVSPLPVSTTNVALPGRCAAAEVGARLGEFLSNVNARNGPGVARAFDPAGFLWEPRQHADPPNGTAGGLRTTMDIEQFLSELKAGKERWVDGSVSGPVGDANLPAETGFGLGFTVVGAGARHFTGAKVVISCVTGLITHMAGPSG